MCVCVCVSDYELCVCVRESVNLTVVSNSL